jgi:hypothetical protein
MVHAMGQKSISICRLAMVAAQGVASGTPMMVGSRLLQGWLTASGIPWV